MSQMIQSRTRAQVRQSVGRIVTGGQLIVSTATATVDTTSLQDTTGLARGGDDTYNGRHVSIYTPTGSIAAGEKSWVADFDSGATKDATMAPAFSASITSGDAYEMWPPGFDIDEIDDAINRVLIDLTDDTPIEYQTLTTFTLRNTLEYALSTYKAVHSVEYVSREEVEFILHHCDAVWTELVDGDVTASLSTSGEMEGSGWLKLVVAAGASANDILATDAITSMDISECTEIMIGIHSSGALAAGDMQLLLDDTAQCASPVETLNIPATVANTKTWHSISLANPLSDTAIISVGIKMVTDATNTVYIDQIRAVGGRVFSKLSNDHWGLVPSLNYLRLTPAGLFVCRDNTMLRITGYKNLTLPTADTSTLEVDPAYVIAQAAGEILIGHSGKGSEDVKNRQKRGEYWLGNALGLKAGIKTRLHPETRMF